MSANLKKIFNTHCTVPCGWLLIWTFITLKPLDKRLKHFFNELKKFSNNGRIIKILKFEFNFVFTTVTQNFKFIFAMPFLIFCLIKKTLINSKNGWLKMNSIVLWLCSRTLIKSEDTYNSTSFNRIIKIYFEGINLSIFQQ